MAIADFDTVSSPPDPNRQDASRSPTLSKILVPIALFGLVGIVFTARLPKLWVCTFPHPEHNAASALASAAALFRASYGTGSCPTVEDLKRNLFLSDDRITEDPWGTPYRIACEPESIVVVSAGPDLIFDTEDDIGSREPR